MKNSEVAKFVNASVRVFLVGYDSWHAGTLRKLVHNPEAYTLTDESERQGVMFLACAIKEIR